MTGEPVTLIEPQILHRDDRHTVWHAGLVQGPTGTVVLSLQIDSPEERRFRDDPAWQPGGAPPVDAYIQMPGVAGPAVGSFSFGRDKFSFHFQEWFQTIDPQRLLGATLHIKIHPLGLDLVIDL